MIMPAQTPETIQSATVTPGSSTTPSVAIFTLPKPFSESHTCLIQRNAVASWKELGPAAEVILLGNEHGIEETAKEFDCKHSGEIRSNSQGTPLLSDAFRLASQMTRANILIYCNCDVMLFNDLLQAIEHIQSDGRLDSFVAFGRRTDLRVETAIDFSNTSERERLWQLAREQGRKAPVVCKEFFAFTRDLYQDIPEFAVGRGNWDNWMLAHAKKSGIPVVNVTPMVKIIHQDHNYLHLKKSRMNCYVSGDEARNNQRLAGGKNIVSGSTGTWTLGVNGLKKNRASWLNHTFWLDFHRFARLVARLPFER